MPVCAVVDGSGYLQPNPALSPSDAACTYMLETFDEYMQGWHGLADLSVESANTISLAILLLWAGAWGFRIIARQLWSSGVSAGSSDDD